MRFSDRIGATTSPTVLLLDTISPALRNSLWNYLLHTLFAGEEDDDYAGAVETITEEFFKYPIDSLAEYGFERKDWLREIFFDAKTPSFQIYNLIEYIVANGPRLRHLLQPADTIPALNKILQEEMSGYRFINGILAPISSEHEVSAVTGAMAQATNLGLLGVDTHLRSAVRLMSQKPNPDYRNSIKESISFWQKLLPAG